MKIPDILKMCLISLGVAILLLVSFDLLVPEQTTAQRINTQALLENQCERFRVTCTFDDDKMKHGAIAWVNVWTKHIYFRERSYSVNEALSTFCHEVAHIIDFNNGRHKMVYTGFYKVFPLEKRVRLIIAMERGADRTGHKVCAKYFPSVDYEYGYGDPNEPVPQYVKDFVESKEK